MIKKVFKILDMHCTACAMNIDGALEDTEGVKSANTNYAKAQTEVEYDDKKFTEEQILRIIRTAGYNATLIN